MSSAVSSRTLANSKTATTIRKMELANNNNVNYELAELQPLFEQYLNEVEEKGEHFPVDFDDAWQWAGYSQKGYAKSVLEKHFVCDVDFAFVQTKANDQPKQRGGHNKQLIKLTINTLKEFLLVAETESARQIRKHFIDYERKWRLAKKNVENGRIAVFDKLSGEVINNPIREDILSANERRQLYKRKAEMELVQTEQRFNAEIAESRARTQQMMADALEKEYNVKRRVITDFSAGALDDRDRIYSRDLERRLADYMAAQMAVPLFGVGQLQLEAPIQQQLTEISFPMVAIEYGYKYDKNKRGLIGKMMARLYRQRHNVAEPPKRTAIIDGRPMLENAYFSDDKDLMRYAVMSYASNVSSEDCRMYAHENGLDTLE